MHVRKKKRPMLTFQSITSPGLRRLRRKRRGARKKRQQSSEYSPVSQKDTLDFMSHKEKKKVQEKIIRHQRWLNSLHKREKTQYEKFMDKVHFYFKCAGVLTFGFMIGFFINAVVLLT